MTKKLTFTGYSDDLFCVSVDGISSDEIYTYGNIKAIYTLETATERMLVVGEYISDCWCIGVSPFDEKNPIPLWNISLSQNNECKYSPLLTIICPDDVLIINNR